ncbi:zinc-binding anti-sigmaE4 factor ChrR [Psychromonas marina]|uniref:Zinc-binding anti-sigmaE4 factor ChrR n=1 Tax=Psychromonas marina TaxID=88364 RepID=A0ABQ6E426_9GAMM|nr:ChrR family anti-sigma-E factor [Psychromonas marina]GLS91935.1 zinc-binding anti-sigmaE4 factor ChrR [Psychromonas marina]
MIKHHPNEQLLAQYSSGELAFSLSIAISAHLEMCPQCQQKEQRIVAQQAEQAWDADNVEEANFDDMLQCILATPIEAPKTKTLHKKKANNSVSLEGKTYTLPTAFRSFEQLKWSGFGTINRARVINDEQDVRASLLHIKQGGEIPAHQHKGYELTLLLAGSFSDEHGTYQKGDFILLSGDVKHSPKTEQGCLCYTVQDAPLHFMSGMSKVLNPLGKFIY